MFKSSMFYVTITTLILINVVIISALNFPFHWVFYLTIIGQISLVIMVYKVLTDNYVTDKTFDHFYEDHPVEPLNINNEEEKFRL